MAFINSKDAHIELRNINGSTRQARQKLYKNHRQNKKEHTNKTIK